MIEFLNSLEWPAVFAIVGSVVTIVTGLFGYLLSARRQEAAKAATPSTHTLTTEEYEKIHSRINDLVDRVAANERDLKETRASIRSLQNQISTHEQRDIDDFKLLEAKLDRLMDIVVRILQEDH